MINKTLHLTVSGFYTVLALFCALGAILLGNAATTAFIIFIAILFICAALQAFVIGREIFRFSSNAYLDLEDTSVYLREEAEKTRATLDRFADVLDTVLEQQQETDEKLVKIDDQIVGLKLDNDKLNAFKHACLNAPVAFPAEAEEKIPTPEPVREKPRQKSVPKAAIDKERAALTDDYPDDAYYISPQTESFADPKQEKTDYAPNLGIPKSEADALAPENEVFAPVTPNAVKERGYDFLEEEDDEAEERFIDAPTQETLVPYTPPYTPPAEDEYRNGADSEPIAVKEAFVRSFQEKDEAEADEEEFITENIKTINAELFEREDDEEEFLDISHVLSASRQEQEEASAPAFDAGDGPPLSAERFDNREAPPPAYLEKPAPIAEKTPPKPAAVRKKDLEANEQPAAETLPPLKELVKDDPSVLRKRSRAGGLQEKSIPSLERLKGEGAKNEAPSVEAPEKAPHHKPKKTRESGSSFSAVLSASAAPEKEKTGPGTHIREVLRYAMEHNAVDLFLHPVLDFVSREVRFFEGVSRIRDQEDRYYTADQFIDVANEGGMTGAIDRLLLTRSVQIIRALKGVGRNIGIFSNVLLSSVTDRYFFDEFIDMIREKGDISEKLVLVFKQDQLEFLTAAGVEKLNKLAGIGFRFCLDRPDHNFLSLSHLSEIGFRYLKVSPSILKNGLVIDGAPCAGEALRKICNLKQCELIVSGIADEETAATVTEIGVDMVQGPLYGDPERVDRSQLNLA